MRVQALTAHRQATCSAPSISDESHQLSGLKQDLDSRMVVVADHELVFLRSASLGSPSSNQS